MKYNFLFILLLLPIALLSQKKIDSEVSTIPEEHFNVRYGASYSKMQRVEETFGSSNHQKFSLDVNFPIGDKWQLRTGLSYVRQGSPDFILETPTVFVDGPNAGSFGPTLSFVSQRDFIGTPFHAIYKFQESSSFYLKAGLDLMFPTSNDQILFLSDGSLIQNSSFTLFSNMNLGVGYELETKFTSIFLEIGGELHVSRNSSLLDFNNDLFGVRVGFLLN